MKTRMTVGLLAVLTLLITACSGIPGSGPVHDVSRVADQVSDSSAPAPVAGSGPALIVSGFIQAAARVSSTGKLGTVFDAPAQYLTAAARAGWKTKPPDTVQILSDPKVVQGNNGLVTITGTSEGSIDQDKSYSPGNGASITVKLHLVQENGQWRISNPPKALLIQQSDFNRVYSARTVYFLDSTHTVVVPDRRYLLTGTATTRVSTLINLLLAGPAGVLRNAAQSELTGASLRTAVVIDDSGVAHVDLLGVDIPKPADQAALAAQIVWTLNPDVIPVLISVNGELLNNTPYTRQALESFSPDRVPGSGQVVSDPYFVDDRGAVVDLLTDRPMNGPFGTGSERVVSAAMSAGTGMVAAVSQAADSSGQNLRIGRFDGGTPKSALQAKSLTQPSFNRTGDEVWVVQNGATAPEIYQVSTSLTGAANGISSRAKVAFSGLAGKAITGLALSPDGVRVAIVAGEQLYMGAIASSANATPKPGAATTTAAPDAPDTLSVINLTPIRDELSGVGPVAFSSATQLVAVGHDTGGSAVIRSVTEMDVDGFSAAQLTSTGLTNDVQSLAVSNASTAVPTTSDDTPSGSSAPVAASMYVVYGYANQPGQIAALSTTSTSSEWVPRTNTAGGDGKAVNVFFPN